MGARIMAGLAFTPRVHELVLAGMPAAAGEDVVGMVRSTTDVAARIGLANVTRQLLRVRGALRAGLGSDAELPLVRVIGHHNQVYPVMRVEPPADPNERVRVFLGEHGERADHLAYIGHPYTAG